VIESAGNTGHRSCTVLATRSCIRFQGRRRHRDPIRDLNGGGRVVIRRLERPTQAQRSPSTSRDAPISSVARAVAPVLGHQHLAEQLHAMRCRRKRLAWPKSVAVAQAGRRMAVRHGNRDDEPRCNHCRP